MYHRQSIWFAGSAVAIAALLAHPAAAGEERDVTIIRNGVVVGGDHVSSGSVAVLAAGPQGEGHRVEVRVENGEVSVNVDGKEIPVERIRLKDGRVVIVDDDGNEQSLFGVVVGEDDRAWRFRFGGEGDMEGPMRWGRLWEDFSGPRPTVMLGIHMTEPGKALEHHLGLKPGNTTMITGVYEGLPAHEAGLEEFDIIVAVDGERPADPGSIRDILADMEAEDVVTLTIIHKGERDRVRAVLRAFDGEAMREAPLIGSGPGLDVESFLRTRPGLERGRQGMDWQDFLVDPDSARLFRMLRDGDRFRDAEKIIRERVPRDLAERLEKLNERVAELKEMLDRLVGQARELAEEADER